MLHTAFVTLKIALIPLRLHQVAAAVVYFRVCAMNANKGMRSRWLNK